MCYRLLIPMLFSWVLLGCGEGQVQQDKITLTFISSNIDQFTDGVPHNIGRIEIQVKEDLNPASVTNETVHLMVGQSTAHDHSQLDPELDDLNGTPFSGTDLLGTDDAIDGQVWFDSTSKTIIFEPRKRLSPGVTYHIRVHNVELSNGQKITVIPRTNGTETGVIQFSFSTTHEHEVLRVRYDDKGNELAYVSYVVIDNVLKEQRQYNNKKELKFILLYNEPLPPPSTRVATQIYKDTSNMITHYDYEFTDSTGKLISLRATETGVDQVWGTDDDLIYSWSEKNEQHLSHEISKNYSLVDKSQLMVWSGVNTPGFKLQSIYLTEHAGINFQHRNVFYHDLGEDGIIDTDPVTQDLTVMDDNVSLWHKRDFMNGKRVRSWSINGVGDGEGADSKLFTNDDIATGLSTIEYYPDDGSPLSGLRKKAVTYFSHDFLQPLNTWLVDELNNVVRSDAPVHDYRIFNYDAFGNQTEELRYSPGPDKIMNTADDYLMQRKTFSTLPTVTGGVELGLN